MYRYGATRQIPIPRHAIRLSVFTGHVVLLLLFSVPMFIRKLDRPPPDIVQVSLLGLPDVPEDKTAPEPLPTPEPEPPKAEPAPAVKEPPAPKPPEPEPEKAPPKPEPPKPLPPPEPKTARIIPTPPPPKPKPVVKPPEPKKEPPKPTPVKPVVKPPEPPKPKPPEKSTWRPRTAEEIRKSANLKTTKPAAPKPPTIDPNKLADKLRNRLRSVSVAALPSSAAGSPKGAALVNPAQSARYFELVSARLHEMWDQPTRAAVGNRQPRVTVHITVQPDGRVTAARVDRASGVMPMDSSVAVVLKGLERLPPYRDYGITEPSLDIEVAFELD